jgi:hypothetical protein
VEVRQEQAAEEDGHGQPVFHLDPANLRNRIKDFY